jgi:glycosyltransferase involved in cell wall biosynthesis
VQAAGLTDRFIFTGARADMADVYSAIDLCVLSSAYGEGFPNVLGEAMACGTPCVATEVGDAAMILEHWGRIAPPRDPARLANQILEALEDPPTTQSRQSMRAYICERFSVAAMVSNTERVLWPGVFPGERGSWEP